MKEIIISWDATRYEYLVRFMIGDTQVTTETYKSISKASASMASWLKE